MISSFTQRRYVHWWLDRCYLYVGRMSEAKGVLKILRAWLKLADQLGSECPPIWLVGGSPKEIEAVRNAISEELLKKYESSDRIKWWGYLDANGISTLLLKAYVLITHSLYEPGGRVILEALAQGIPVIATPHGFAADLITDWHNGFLVSFGDEERLRKRMEHFALQPLLRHSMGRVAHDTASIALQEWNFMETHFRVYQSAVRKEVNFVPMNNAKLPSGISRDPIPQWFDGVYPFEGEAVSSSELLEFFSESFKRLDEAPKEIAAVSGRSRLWIGRADGQAWIVKHSFSTYRRRPMWDRGFGGEVAIFQNRRMRAEELGSHCDGAVEAKAIDKRLGLLICPWLDPVRVDELTIQACAEVFSRFHRTSHPTIDLFPLRFQIDRNWNEMDDEEVVHSFSGLEADWRAADWPWNAWCPVSLTMGWRWLKVALIKGWVTMPPAINAEINLLIDRELGISTDEAKLKLGLCHGDGDPNHVRLDENGKMFLIDCERLHPGYFGNDWANLVLGAMKNWRDQERSIAFLKQSFDAIESDLCPRHLLISWFLLNVAMRFCRAQGLLNTGALENARRDFHKIKKVINSKVTQ